VLLQPGGKRDCLSRTESDILKQWTREVKVIS
jgi:hypothetical protein